MKKKLFTFLLTAIFCITFMPAQENVELTKPIPKTIKDIVDTFSLTDDDLSMSLNTYRLTGDKNIVDTSMNGASYYLDGTSDYIEVSDDADIDFGTYDFTVEMVIKPLNVTDTGKFLINKEDSGVGWGLKINEDDLQIRFDDGSNDATGDIALAVFTANQWTHVLVKFDRDGYATAWINGINEGSVDISSSSATISNAGALRVGTETGGTTNEFNGYIGRVRLFNRTFFSSGIYHLYSGAAPCWRAVDASNTELMPNTVDRDFSGASAWANNDINSYDETGDLTITANAVDQYCTLAVASAPTDVERKYRMTFDVANIVSTWTVKSFDGTKTIGTISADGTDQVLEWIASTTGGYRLVAVANDSSGDFDNFTLTRIGNVAEYESDNMEVSSWHDSNDNENEGTVTGATAINLPEAAGIAEYTRSISLEPRPNTSGATWEEIGHAMALVLDADADQVFYAFNVPDDWNESSDLTITIGWISDPGDAVADTETVKLDVNYNSLATGSVIDGATQETSDTYTASGNQTDKEFFSQTLTLDYDDATVTIDENQKLFMELNRDVTADSYSGDVLVVCFRISYTSNEMPSN